MHVKYQFDQLPKSYMLNVGRLVENVGEMTWLLQERLFGLQSFKAIGTFHHVAP